AETVGISRRTVYRYLELSEPPARPQRSRTGRGLLAPYAAYLRERWQEGCHNRTRLFREIREQGYQYGARNVFRFLKRVAYEPVLTPAPPAANPKLVPTVRDVARLLVQRADELGGEDRAYLQRLCAQEPTIATTYTLTQEFATMLRTRQGKEQ